MRFQNSKYKRAAAALMSASVLLSSGSMMSNSLTASATDHNYGEALALSLYFFDSNACGSGITGGPLTWRGDCHTYDGHAKVSEAENLPGSAKSIIDPDGDGTFDMDGGYHDAGDHVKFNLTIGFSMSSLALADYLNDGIFEKAGCQEHFAAILKRGADYLMKTTVLNSSGEVEAICYQVSDSSDHSYWTAPETQTYQRKTYWMGPNNNNTKICGDMVNGLAGTAYALRNFDPEYSAKCLKYAKALYEFGKNHKGNEQTGNGGMYGNAMDYQDEFLTAQAWLYLNKAGDKPTTVPNSHEYSSEFGKEYDGYLYSWDKQYQGYCCMMYKITGDEAYKKELISEYNNQGGLPNGTFVGKWTWGNSRYNCAVQMTALAIAGKDKESEYAKGAKYQMDVILGDNKYNYSFLIGFGENWPTHFHHRAANPGQNGETSAQNPNCKYVNYGMLVGGVDDNGYDDHADKYQYTEGALDYNACFALACAGLYRLYGGDASAVKQIEQNASEINSSYVFPSGSSSPSETDPPAVETTAAPSVEETTAPPAVETTAAPDSPKPVWGDADLSGDVDVTDAVLIARLAVGDNVIIKDQGVVNSDVTHDGNVRSDDVLKVVRHIAGYVTEDQLAEAGS